MSRHLIASLCAIAATLGAGGALAQGGAPADEESALDIVATTVRSQGYTCEQPKRAVRDEGDSSPDRAGWLIECAHARYRVKYDNDVPAQVTQLD